MFKGASGITEAPKLFWWAMWDYCGQRLETVRVRGASYADVRVMHLRQRDLTTKNRKVGTLGQSESIGLGIRVSC